MRRLIVALFVLIGLSAVLAIWGTAAEIPVGSPPTSTARAPRLPMPPSANASLPSTDYAVGAAVAAALPLITSDEQVPGYRRDAFGSSWADVDQNGCNQRQDVLVRDLLDETIADDGCTVLSGKLLDPYTAETIQFEHDRIAKPGSPGSQGVQIDHVVSLSAAYVGGAWRWEPRRRLEFANSFENLLAVDGPTNTSKSDRGPAGWLPPNAAYVCDYALNYAGITTKWSLAVEEADRVALVAVLTECAK